MYILYNENDEQLTWTLKGGKKAIVNWFVMNRGALEKDVEITGNNKSYTICLFGRYYFSAKKK